MEGILLSKGVKGNIHILTEKHRVGLSDRNCTIVERHLRSIPRVHTHANWNMSRAREIWQVVSKLANSCQYSVTEPLIFRTHKCTLWGNTTLPRRFQHSVPYQRHRFTAFPSQLSKQNVLWEGSMAFRGMSHRREMSTLRGQAIARKNRATSMYGVRGQSNWCLLLDSGSLKYHFGVQAGTPHLFYDFLLHWQCLLWCWEAEQQHGEVNLVVLNSSCKKKLFNAPTFSTGQHNWLFYVSYGFRTFDVFAIVVLEGDFGTIRVWILSSTCLVPVADFSIFL